MKQQLLNQTIKLKRFTAVLFFFSLLFSMQSFAVETSCGHISSFEFSNGSSSVTITNNGTYALSELPNNFYIDVIVSGHSESARIRGKNLNTGGEVTIIENYLPYTFPAGNGAWSYGTGYFEIKAKIYKYDGCNSYSCDTEYIRFTLTNTPACGQIDGLEFTNGTNSVSVVNGGSYDIADLPYNFYADLKVSGNTESASNRITNLDTGAVYTNVENILPYTYPSYANAWDLGTGTFQFYSEVFKHDNCSSVKCDHICITFTLYEQNCGEISQFEFSNGTDTMAIADGGTYDINTLPTDFYVDGIISGQSESLRFNVENLDTNETYSIIENYLPYTFPAGNGAWFLGTGTFEIKGSLFSGNYCNSQLCDEETVTFTLTDGGQACLADFGTYTIDAVNILVSGSAPGRINVTLNADVVIPTGFTTGIAVTQTDDLIITDFSTELFAEFSVGGFYKLHLLVYDVTTLDVSSIVFGQTTAADVLNTIAANNICASLDPVGKQIFAIQSGPDQRVASNDQPIKTETKEITTVVAKTEELPSTDNNVDIKLFPNPVVDNLNVEILLLDAEVMNYTMIDLNGKEVGSGSFDNSSFGTTKVNTSKLANGLYIITFESNFRSFSKKVQVNH